MRLIVTFLLVLINITVFSQVRLAKIFGDHMVLQRQKPIPIWGWADKGENIKLIFNKQSFNIKAGSDGKWMIKIPAMQAGGPYLMEIKGKKNSFEVKDILVGEVWICSGQSNMEWKVSSSDNAAAEIRTADFPQIRHLKVETDRTIT